MNVIPPYKSTRTDPTGFKTHFPSCQGKKMNLIFLAINHYHHKIKFINILSFFSFEGHNTLSMPKY